VIDRSAVVFPNVDPEEWAERYGIEVKEHPCPECGSLFWPTVPIAMKGYRGLQTVYHGCETANGCPFSVVPVGEKAKQWKALLAGLKDWFEEAAP
jgi:hypothetical protein